MKNWHLRILILCLVLVFTSISTAFGAELGSNGMIVIHKWWSPTYMPSVDAALGAIRNLQAAFCQWNGAFDHQQISVDPYGLRVTAALSGVNTSSQWVPNYGGYWVGNKYVPYSGGSTQTTQTPYSKDYTTTVDFGKVRSLSVKQYPNLDRDNKWGLVINYSDGSMVAFRAISEAAVLQLANAIATLTVASGKELATGTGAYFYAGKQPVEDEVKLRKSLKWIQDTGAPIVNMEEGNGPFTNAGLQKNDIILKANGEEVKSGDHWLQIVGTALIDKTQAKFDLEIFRNGVTIPKELTIYSFNIGKEKILPISGQPSLPAKQPVTLGIEARSLSDDEIAANGNLSGLRILNVTEGGLAAKSGVKANDILLEVNGKSIKDISQLKAILTQETPNKFKVVRDGSTLQLDAVASL